MPLSRFEEIRNLRKWAFFIAAACAVIGCGGGGNDSSSGSGSGGTTTGTSLQTKLNSDYGTIQFTYLVGQGRAAGDLVAVVRNLEVEDEYGLVRTQLEADHSLPLDNYIIDVVRLNVPFTSQSNRLFESFPLIFTGFKVETSTGDYTELDPPTTVTFPSRIRVLPGRDTSLPLFIDDSMFAQDGSGGVTFDSDLFSLRNGIESSTDPILTYFSDYVSWDLSSMDESKRPTLTDGTVATRLFLSGDNYAIGATNMFEVLTLDASEPISGTYGDENIGNTIKTPGTYTLLQADPSDLFGVAQITAAAGVWRDSVRALSGTSTFDFILFPTSRYEAADDSNGNGLRPDEDQEIMIVQRNTTGGIVEMYYGYADLATGEFYAYPIKDIVNAGIDGELSGTLSNYKTSQSSTSTTTVYDSVKYGTYTFSTSSTLPSGFLNTGTFFVYR